MTLLFVVPVRGEEPLVIAPKMGWIGALSFRRGTDRLAIGTSESKIGIWDIKEKELVETLSSIDGSAVTALNGERYRNILIAGTQQGARRVHMFSPDVGGRVKVTGDWKPHRGSVHAITPVGKGEFASAGMEGTIWICSDESGEVKKTLKGHTSWVNSLSYLESQKLLASAGSDNSVRLWDMESGKETTRFTVKEGEIRSVALSPDGKHVAAGIRYGWVRVWERESKKEVALLKVHEGEMGAVLFTPDGKTLISGGGDWNKPGEVRLIDAATWKVRTTLKHSGEVLCLALSNDGKWLAAGSWDGTVRVWEVSKQR
jgi:WD40 repeat protein